MIISSTGKKIMRRNKFHAFPLGKMSGGLPNLQSTFHTEPLPSTPSPVSQAWRRALMAAPSGLTRFVQSYHPEREDFNA